MIKKIILTICILFLAVSSAYARVNVDDEDLAGFKDEFYKYIVQDVNDSGVSDDVIYGYIVSAINSSWDRYSGIPFYLYVNNYGKIAYTTYSKGDSRFSDQNLKTIAFLAKARFFKCMYNSMRDIDISKVGDPDWMTVALQDREGDVLYLLEMNFANLDSTRMEKALDSLIASVKGVGSDFNSVGSRATFRLTIATYCKEFDEIVICTLFTDNNGNVLGEMVLMKNVILRSLG